MSSLCQICSRQAAYLLTVVILLGFAASGRADPKPLSKEEQAKVDKAIDKAIGFLKGAQTKEGDWQWKMYKDGRYLVGQCALPAYALLEAGVPADDPVIQKAANYIRPRVLTNDQTYELSVAILFFDLLGDPKDKKLIRKLALRLIAGQHYTGGWSYRCPTISEQNELELLKILEVLNKRMAKGDKTRDKAIKEIEVPPALKVLTVFQPANVLDWKEPPLKANAYNNPLLGKNPLISRTDNSNTQFAILGLWAAQRLGVPVQATFELMVERFERSHFYPSGLWLYRFDGAFDDAVSLKDRNIDIQYKRSMTCVGLIGLAIGRGLRMKTPGAIANDEKDIHVLKGFAALRGAIGKPSVHMNERIRPLPDLYFLWSLERVGMLYDLPNNIGEKQWYRWGTEALVTNQTKSGGWPPSIGGLDYKATVNTAFALLFLKRSHPMKDLTSKLPLTAKKLNEGIANLRHNDRFPDIPIATPVKSRSRYQSTTPPDGNTP